MILYQILNLSTLLQFSWQTVFRNCWCVFDVYSTHSKWSIECNFPSFLFELKWHCSFSETYIECIHESSSWTDYWFLLHWNCGCQLTCFCLIHSTSLSQLSKQDLIPLMFRPTKVWFIVKIVRVFWKTLRLIKPTILSG